MQLRLLTGPLDVVAPHIVQGGGCPGFAPVHTDPMQGSRTLQQDRGISFLIGVRSRSLAAFRCGSQGWYSQQLHCFAVPLLFDLMPPLALIVGAVKSAIAIQR